MFKLVRRERSAIPQARVNLPGYVVIDSPDGFQWLDNHLSAYDGVASLDTETRGWDTKCHPKGKAFATCVTIATDEFPNIYVDNYSRAEGNIRNIAKWVEDPSKRKVLHNAKFDMHVFANHGMSLEGLYGDTMVMDFLLDTSAQGQHDLETCLLRWFGEHHDGYADTFRRFLLKKNGEPSKKSVTVPHHQWWDEGHEGKVIHYACKDTREGLRLFYHHKDKLEKIPWIKAQGLNYWDYYTTFELPYTSVLYRMERRGVRVSKFKLAALEKKYSEVETESLEQFTKELYALGVDSDFLEKFNPNSSKQLANLLFDVLGYEPVKMTSRKPGASRSTDEEVIDKLVARGATFLTPLVEARRAAKNRATYAVALRKWSREYGGKIHTSFNQIGAQTARLSSSKPNLQNIPIRTPLGKLLRDVFISSKGCTLVNADYSQIEVRVMAHRSQDPTLLRFVVSGGDAHSLTAWFIMPEIGLEAEARDIIERFGTDPEASAEQPSMEGLNEIKKTFKDERDKSKTLNFAIQYGAGAPRAASVFGISETAGQRAIDRYMDGYSGVAIFMDKRHKQARTNGYIRTVFGRYSHLPHAQGKSFALRKAAERQSVNYDIQGSARDVIMAGMLLLDRDQRLKDLGAEMVLQVHDELMFDVPDANVDEVKRIVKEVMEDPYTPFGLQPLTVPTVAEVGSGKSWGTAH